MKIKTIKKINEEKCWDGYKRNYDVPKGQQGSCELKEDELEEKKKRKKKKKVKKKKKKKDACYRKVKSRYDVWPSAYASGALVKCRKVGAKNWGNKSKKKNESLNEEEQELTDSEIDQLEDVQDQLKGAVKAHDKQQKMIGKVLDDKELDEELSLKKKITIRIIKKIEEEI